MRAIAAHREAPTAAPTGSLVQISWRLADALGFRAFPERESSYAELITHMPAVSATSWLKRDPAKPPSELAARLAEAAAQAEMGTTISHRLD